MSSRVVTFFAAACLSLSALAEESIKQTVKDTTRTIGHETKKAAKAVGHATRDATKAVGHATRDATRTVGHESKKAVKEARKAVSGESK